MEQTTKARLVVLLPIELKRRIVAAARRLEDLGEPEPTLTRVVRDVLSAGIASYGQRSVK